MPSIKWKGEDLGLWSGKPTLKECRRIKSELGYGPKEFQDQFEVYDAEAWSMFVAIMLSRKGDLVNFEAVDGEYDDLELVPTEEEKQAAEAVEKAAVGKAPRSGNGTGTSKRRATSGSTPGSSTSTAS